MGRAEKRKLSDIVPADSTGDSPSTLSKVKSAKTGAEDSITSSNAHTAEADVTETENVLTTPAEATADSALNSSTPQSSSTATQSTDGRHAAKSATPQTQINKTVEPQVADGKNVTTVQVDNHLIMSLDYQDTDVLQRLSRFLSWKTSDGMTFSVLNLPTDLDWASAHTSEQKNLCRRASRKPVTFWLPGTVKTRFFYSAGGQPLERVTVSVVPATKAAFDAARHILMRFSSQTTSPAIVGDAIKVSRWQTTAERGTPWNVVKEFTNVYDATASFLPKSRMTCIGAASIHFDDTVLVEATVSRYRPKGEKASWQATFNLQNISLLAQSPAVNSEPIAGEDGPDVNI